MGDVFAGGGKTYFREDLIKTQIISRNGNDENAASRLPRKSCQVPNVITASANKIVNIATGLFIAG
jgi:hypothetical protein